MLASLSASCMVHKTKLEEANAADTAERGEESLMTNFITSFFSATTTSSGGGGGGANKKGSGPPPKPEEWQTIDLEKQRREFGESINGLGSNRLSRVWAAGMTFSLSLSFLVFFYCNLKEKKYDTTIYVLIKF